nr:MAG TPA: hypothetical protein [Caudoviricetes sp.]
MIWFNSQAPLNSLFPCLLPISSTRKTTQNHGG